MWVAFCTNHRLSYQWQLCHGLLTINNINSCIFLLPGVLNVTRRPRVYECVSGVLYRAQAFLSATTQSQDQTDFSVPLNTFSKVDSYHPNPPNSKFHKRRLHLECSNLLNISFLVTDDEVIFPRIWNVKKSYLRNLKMSKMVLKLLKEYSLTNRIFKETFNIMSVFSWYQSGFWWNQTVPQSFTKYIVDY